MNNSGPKLCKELEEESNYDAINYKMEKINFKLRSTQHIHMQVYNVKEDGNTYLCFSTCI